MNRRAFLKLIVMGVAVASIPIPNFLLPKDTAPEGAHHWNGTEWEPGSMVLTQKMIEDASRRALENYGRPDQIYMSKKTYKKYAKRLGWQVVYKNDEIMHVRYK